MRMNGAEGERVSAVGALRVLAWEVTRRCAMKCRHCRGAARDMAYADELTTEEGCRVLDSIAEAGAHPLILFTGGEALCREDLEALVAHAAGLGFPCALATCGNNLSRERLLALKAAGIRTLSVSIDGVDEAAHDAFRGVPGAYRQALRTMALARECGVAFQVNSVVSKATLPHLRAFRDFALAQGACRIDYFFLVPVGRGKGIADACLSSEEAEAAFAELLALEAEGTLSMHLTCAPQFVRRLPTSRPHSYAPQRSHFNGCLAGNAFAFLSHVGDLQPCGFLDILCGNVRDYGCDFAAAFNASATFAQLRQPLTEGHCGSCPQAARCRGCRARAYAATGDFRAADPSCIRAVK